MHLPSQVGWADQSRITPNHFEQRCLLPNRLDARELARKTTLKLLVTTSAESRKPFSPANDQRILQATVLHCILVLVRLLWKVPIKLLLGQFQVNSSRDEVLHRLINIYFKQWCCALPWIELNCREKYLIGKISTPFSDKFKQWCCVAPWLELNCRENYAMPLLQLLRGLPHLWGNAFARKKQEFSTVIVAVFSDKG